MENINILRLETILVNVSFLKIINDLEESNKSASINKSLLAIEEIVNKILEGEIK